MKGFIEVNFWGDYVKYEKAIVHYSQIYFKNDKKAYWGDRFLKESYEEIKELIKQAQ